MSEPVDIGGGWKVMEVKGLGCIVQAEMGLIFIDDTTIVDGELVVTPQWTSALAVAEKQLEKQRAKSLAPSSGPEAITSFLQQTDQRDLTSTGQFGPLGATIKKLRENLKAMESGSALEESVGTILLTGDHVRHGAVAALVALTPEQTEILDEALSGPDLQALDAVLDRLTVGNVVLDKAQMDGSKTVAA
jgi:Fe-S cluster assembly ATPase SufC